MQYRILWYHNSNQPRLGAIYLRVIIICLLFLFRNFRFSPNYISWYLFRILTDYNYLLFVCLFFNLLHFRLFSLKLTLEWFFLAFLSFTPSFLIYLRILPHRPALTIRFLFFISGMFSLLHNLPFLPSFYIYPSLFYYSAVFSSLRPLPLFLYFLSSF